LQNGLEKIEALRAKTAVTLIPKPLSAIKTAAAAFGISEKMVEKAVAVYLHNQKQFPINIIFRSSITHKNPVPSACGN